MARGSPWEVWGLNPKLGSPVYSTRDKKEPRKHPAVKRRVSICQGGMAGDTESLLKGQCTKFSLQPLTLGSGEGGQSRLEMCEESLGLVALERELKDQLPGSLC